MAGTISLSLSQQFDSLGAPLNGGRLYFYQAGTTASPQNAYQDSALTIPHPNPLTLDSAGRVPQLFFADGNIKVRLTDANLVTQFVADNILVVGPSSGGGGGGTVDPATVFSTGNLKSSYGTSVLSGWVRANAKTIGSATSGATERANSDTSALFVYLWDADTSLAVSGGRGVSAAADFAANKTIALPDLRGRVTAGFDDMGNSAAGRLTAAVMSGVGIGAVGGAQTQTLVAGQIPSLTSVNPSQAISVALPTGGSSSRYPYSSNGDLLAFSAAGAGAFVSQYSAANNWALANGMSGSNSISVAYTNGSPTALITTQPTIFVTMYIKL